MITCDLDEARFRGAVLTIGNFDGMHLGHQALIAAARRRADAAGTRAVVLTFDPHPSAILTPDRVPPTLTPREEKLRWLAAAGADVVVVKRTTREFLSLSAEQFIREVIVERFHPQALVEGPTFGFGVKRRGDVNMLRDAGRQYGFDVQVVEPVRVGLGGHPDTVISSSLVRHLLTSGTVDAAMHCLGRPYALFGRVTHGAGRGHDLGFPTANLADIDQLIPAEGVYAGQAIVLADCPAPDPRLTTHDSRPTAHDSPAVPAAISIGRKPTFDETALTVEAFLLDYFGDLYGKCLRLEFLDWLRPQEKFPSGEALARAMDTDVGRTRELFIHHRVNYPAVGRTPGP